MTTDSLIKLSICYCGHGRHQHRIFAAGQQPLFNDAQYQHPWVCLEWSCKCTQFVAREDDRG